MRKPTRTFRVALVYDRLYPRERGGVEKRFHEIAVRLAGSVDPWFFHYGTTELEPSAGHFVGLGGSTSAYRGDRRSLVHTTEFAARLARPLLRARPDLIDCASIAYACVPVCAAVARLLRIPLVITWHEFMGEAWRSYVPVPIAPVAAAAERRLPQLAAANVAVSEFTAKRIRTATGVSPRVIENGVDPTALGRVEQKDAIDVLFIGRLIAHKRVDLLLDALAVLGRHGRRLRVVIVGDGPDEALVERRRAALPVGVEVELISDVIDQERLYGLLGSARLFVLPSVREGYGLVVVEAQAAGAVPIVVRAPMNAAASLVEDGRTGIVCDPEPAALAAGIAALLEDPVRQAALREACIASAARRTWAAAAGATLEVYETARGATASR